MPLLEPFRVVPADIRVWGRWFAALNVKADSLNDDIVEEIHIVDNSVTLAKMADMATDSLMGRITAGVGDPEILSGIEAGPIIETGYNNEVAAASQAEAEAGTEAEIRRWSPLRVAQAIIELAKNVVITTVITTSHTVADEDVVLVDDDTAGSTVTVALPASASREKPVHIKKLGTTANVVIDPDGTETIDDGLTAIMILQYMSLSLVPDGSNWQII